MPNPLASSSIMVKTAQAPPPKTPKLTQLTQPYLTDLTTSGKVKKMVQEVEARCKPTPTTTSVTKSSSVRPPMNAGGSATAKRLQYSASARTAQLASAAVSASKLRSSIDKRKQRVSGSKPEAKRASLRKVNALLKGLDTETGVDQVDNAGVGKHEPRIVVSTVIDDSMASTVSSSSGAAVAVAAGGMIKKPRELLSSHLIQQNYKVAGAAGGGGQKFGTTSGSSSVNSSIASSLTASAQKSSSSSSTAGFNKFMERNTPCKLTFTVCEFNFVVKFWDVLIY